MSNDDILPLSIFDFIHKEKSSLFLDDKSDIVLNVESNIIGYFEKYTSILFLKTQFLLGKFYIRLTNFYTQN